MKKGFSKKYLHLSLSTSITLMLTGCFGSDPISIVQEIEHPTNRTYLLGKVLENRPVCKNTEWSEFEDDKGRTLVEYRCEIDSAEDFFDDAIGDVEVALDKDIEKMEAELELSKNHAKETIEIYETSLEKFKTFETEGRLSDQNQEIYSLEPRGCFGMSYAYNETQKIYDCYERDLNSAINSPKIKQAQIDKQKKRSEEMLKWLDVEHVEEVIQWSVSEDDKVTLIYTGALFTQSNGNQQEISYMLPRDFFASTLKDEIKTYKEYKYLCDCPVSSYTSKIQFSDVE